MAIPSLELQKALYAKLSSTGYKVFEVVPANSPFPYIVIGEEILTRDDTKTDERTVHTVTIHTWSKKTSSSELKTLNNFVIQTILNDFFVVGFNVDMVELELLTTLKEQDVTTTTIFHGVLQFEITLTQEV